MSQDNEPQDQQPLEENTNQEVITKITGMYKDWFLDYASYVILERAVPAIEDGFKPVHRRIMQSMKDLDDGRYNKVANIVGHTMQYHPHGDASIGDAMVQVGQKELLIDTQGNWGNILTGDSAAAPRYIEARLSKFALEVLYSPKVTEWQASYDGRRKEPINLPVKFPLLLNQGAEGIAVGLSTKILPHNFNELIDASVNHLKGKRFKIYPDFPTAGEMDISNYNDGLRGGKVRVRAKINQQDKNTLVITEIPYSTTTSTLIESIIKANEKGKIKIKHIEDNTAEHVEILIHLPNNISPDKTIDALFAFTNCEISISPLCCVIIDHKPHFIGVSEILRLSTDHTVELLKKELEIKYDELQEQWHFASLERIFIEKRIYREIEEEETWDGVIRAIDEGLKPHIAHLKRAVNEEDITRLTEIRIKRISKFDLDKAQQKIEALEDEITQVQYNLDHLIEFSISYFEKLKKDYGGGRERKTEIRLFEDIEATKVVIRNTKLYVNRKEGFVGTSLKKDEYVTDCSDIDDIICFMEDGTMMVTKVDTKAFVGKNIIHVAVFKKKDKRTIYNMIYKDGGKGTTYIKRFAVTSITRDKIYDVAKGRSGSKVFYFSANPNGEAEKVTVYLRQVGSIKKLKFEVDFADQLIKGRGAKGNIVTKHPVKKVELKEEGVSTLKPRKIWFDEVVKRLNVEGRGDLLGSFKGEDRLLLVTQNGIIKTIIPELTTRFDEAYILMEKWDPNRPITAVYWEGERERYYVKRFLVENKEKEESIITDHEKSQLELVSTDEIPVLEIIYRKQRNKEQRPNEELNLEEFISVKGIKAMGNQLTTEKVTQLNLLDPIVPEIDDNEEEEEADNEETSTQEENHNTSEENKNSENQGSLFD
ncbi:MULTISPECIES: DNA gyrase/topoisomerase IV subunit A [Mesonia]|uniref:DNA gyrase subunit A n=1 Tax=Mesonia oceanica TaxID=2687242 RepID=A0AC61YD52_9FLAO|nr:MULTISPECIES: DNA gyrase/topoisomerase IV subunit A [Mesonia]MAN26485.1 DNA topoisomerase IV [Mesonia sp.]MAQ39602.1 DNA topoisomerase IV [Mesonia sp.]MBJ97858.1 DNA topoisomerase IV [Flavobacteriaceae bacterium]VVV02343.1 DNA gyrase subunit A [Mesonia oceanica]|tara:strand:+ start:19346 stop:21976 length:2631 start_codon:yes stop_codon:yes gene_type:complete